MMKVATEALQDGAKVEPADKLPEEAVTWRPEDLEKWLPKDEDVKLMELEQRLPGKKELMQTPSITTIEKVFCRCSTATTGDLVT